MSDTRSLIIVSDAATSEKTSTFVIAHSDYDGKVRQGRRALRAQQVNRLKKAIVSGDYQANARRIAKKLLMRG